MQFFAQPAANAAASELASHGRATTRSMRCGLLINDDSDMNDEADV